MQPKTEMSMKPSDFFVGVIDFFSTLVPGAIAAFFLVTTLRPSFIPDLWSTYITWGTVDGWAVFLVLAYVLGHLITAIGSFFLDKPLYDWFYVVWRRDSKSYIDEKEMKVINKCLEKKENEEWGHIGYRIFCNFSIFFIRLLFLIKMLFIGEKRRKDSLLSAAIDLKRKQLNGDVGPMSTFDWANTAVHLKAPEGAAEIDALMAQSKLFRSITVLMLCALVIVDGILDGIPRSILFWFTLLLCIWRFLDLRWKASSKVYQYFLVTDKLKPEVQRIDEEQN